MSLPASPIRRLWYRFVTGVFASISAVLISVYQATLDFTIEGDDELRLLAARKKNFIVATWHTFVYAGIFLLHSRGLYIYSDHPRTRSYEESWTHWFREIGIKTLASLGFDVLDASLGKQSAGVVNFIKLIKGGRPALVAPDGPHGPIYRAKPGVIYMARKADSVVLPVGFGFSRRVVLPNWDDFALPLPFSRVAMVIGEPIEPGHELTDEEMERLTAEMEATLDRLCFRANELLDGKGS